MTLKYDAAIYAAAVAKVWLTKHTQLCIGVYHSVVILCYALVHSWIVKHQAAEPHLFPVKLWNNNSSVKLKYHRSTFHHFQLVYILLLSKG